MRNWADDSTNIIYSAKNIARISIIDITRIIFLVCYVRNFTSIIFFISYIRDFTRIIFFIFYIRDFPRIAVVFGDYFFEGDTG